MLRAGATNISAIGLVLGRYFVDYIVTAGYYSSSVDIVDNMLDNFELLASLLDNTLLAELA